MKKEKKLSTQSLFMKSMSLTQDHKDSLHFSQELQDKSLNKSDNRSIKKYQNGENKEKLKLFPEFYLSTKFICLIWNASLSSIELLKVMLPQLSSLLLTEELPISEVQTTKGIYLFIQTSWNASGSSRSSSYHPN